MVQINMSIPESCAECRLSVRHFGKLYCPPLNDRVGNEKKDSRCPLVDAGDQFAEVSKEVETQMSLADCISRQDALSCFHDWIDQRGDVHTADEMPEYQRIEQLPAAQPERRPYHEEWVSALQTLPEIIRCKDCKHQRVYHYTDKRFKDPDRYVYGCDLMPDGCYLNCFDSYCSEAERRTNE